MCKVEWCNNKPVTSGKGYCRMHYDQIRKYGNVTKFRPKGNRNEYIKENNYTKLHILDENANTIVTTKIDNDIVEKIKKYSFRYEKDKYIKTIKNRKTIYLHQLVLGKTKGLDIDHINRDKLDNRRCNLRKVSHKENCNNRYKNN